MKSTVTILRLRSLPLSERRDELEATIVSVLKASLLMDEDEPLSTSESFFDMGLTSLALTEAKQHLETLLGCQISATAVFNSPTVDRMTEHLAEDVLPDLFEDNHPPVGGGGGGRALWDDVMRDVCNG